MYTSDYSSHSKVSKYSSEGQRKMQYRSKGKSCGYYMRIVFFFSSLIQSLIIVSLVLFLIYGKTQDSASTSRIQDLEESFSRLSIENVALRQQRKNLTNLLNTTLMEKARNDWDLAQLRYFTNISAILIQDIDKRLTQCTGELFFCKATRSNGQCPQLTQSLSGCNCGPQFEQLKAKLELVESNFTQTKQRMRMELDQTAKERDTINLEVIRLRRDKSMHVKEVDFFRQKCKDDFAQSLNGISNVSKAFLEKIDSLFPTHIAFQITCPKQREHLEQIRTNCSSLSREVEDRFQRYLNNVGQQVSTIQAESSRLKAENWRLSDDYRTCSQNRTGLILQHKQNLDKLQRKHDEEKEKLLLDKMRQSGEIEVLENNVKYKTKQVEHLAEQIKQLNMTCMSRTGFGGFAGGSTSRTNDWSLLGGGGSSSSSSAGGQLGRTGSGGLSSNFGSAFNKPASAGAGSSVFNSGSSSSSGSAFNKPAASGAGSSGSFFNSGSSSSSGSVFNKPAASGAGSSGSFFNSGSSSSIGSAFNKPASAGAGSSSSSIFNSGSSSSIGSVFNKPASAGAGSSSSSIFNSGSSSSSGSVFNKPATSGGILSSFGSGGVGSNKPTTSAKSSTGAGSSSGSSTSKSGSSSSWFGFGSSLGQSKTGSGPGKGTSTGTGSSIGGRTGGGSTVSVAQHLKDLQRIINPAAPEEKQDLSRMLG